MGYQRHSPDREDDTDEDFQDGRPIPVVEYEDVGEVVDYQHHLPDDVDCKRDGDEDCEGGIPIGEYEDTCEVVGYRRHLPDDYVDEDFQDGIPIMEYLRRL